MIPALAMCLLGGLFAVMTYGAVIEAARDYQPRHARSREPERGW